MIKKNGKMEFDWIVHEKNGKNSPNLHNALPNYPIYNDESHWRVYIENDNQGRLKIAEHSDCYY